MSISINGLESHSAALAARAQAPQRALRPELSPEIAPRTDQISTASPADAQIAREGAAAAAAAFDRALAAGRAGAQLLHEAAETRRQGGAVDADALRARFEALIAQGGPLAQGQALTVRIDPGSAPIELAAEDLRGAADGGPDQGLARLEAALGRLSETAGRIDAHRGFLARLETALGGEVRPDLTAEEARIAALNVGQGLSRQGAIAAAPHAILSLFRE